MKRFSKVVVVAIVVFSAVATTTGLGQTFPLPSPRGPSAFPEPPMTFPPLLGGPTLRGAVPPPFGVPPFFAGSPFGPEGGRLTPSTACLDMIAMKAGWRAYAKARLDLDSRQLAAWQEFDAAATDVDRNERTWCSRLGAEAVPGSIVKRFEMAEEGATWRLAEIRKLSDPLLKLIGLLSEEQMRLLNGLPPFLL